MALDQRKLTFFQLLRDVSLPYFHVFQKLWKFLFLKRVRAKTLYKIISEFVQNATFWTILAILVTQNADTPRVCAPVVF